MFFLNRKKNKVFAIDIGSSAIKSLILSYKSGVYNLEALNILPLPKDVVIAGEIFNIDIVVKELQKLKQISNFKGLKAFLGIRGDNVIVKKIILPLMSERELETNIKWYIQQYIPFDIETVNYDYDIIERLEDKMVVVIAIAKKSIVSQYGLVISTLGLSLGSIDISSFALFEVFKLNYDIGNEDIIALLDLGASRTSITIIEEGVVSFVKEIKLGGIHMTEVIAKELDLTFEEAEILKTSRDNRVPEEIDQILHQEIEKLSHEILQILTTYQTTYNKVITDIIITGGCINIPWIKNKLQDLLKIPVSILNPFKKINFNNEVFTKDIIVQSIPSIATALGLGIRGIRW